jgi:hypothetical protein
VSHTGDLFALATQMSDECVELYERERETIEKSFHGTKSTAFITWAVHCATNLVLDSDDK